MDPEMHFVLFITSRPKGAFPKISLLRHAKILCSYNNVISPDLINNPDQYMLVLIQLGQLASLHQKFRMASPACSIQRNWWCRLWLLAFFCDTTCACTPCYLDTSPVLFLLGLRLWCWKTDMLDLTILLLIWTPSSSASVVCCIHNLSLAIPSAFNTYMVKTIN